MSDLLGQNAQDEADIDFMQEEKSAQVHPNKSHQLAAIMFTDIQGYTALMQEDEDQAIAVREEHRRIFKSTTEKYKGKILQYYGDGTLSTFDSAVDAVKCGIEMQLEFPIPVRIGIHTGDIIFSDEEIIGDGVNIASRIESLAVVGSVFISGKVYDDIKNQRSISTKLVGSFMLENVGNPVDVYAISNDGLVVPFENQIKGKIKKTKEEVSDREKREAPDYPLKYLIPGIATLLLLSVLILFFLKGGFNNTIVTSSPDTTIAILPFENLSNDPEQEYLSDGITEDMITHLAKINEFGVISRSSVMNFKNTTMSINEIGRQLDATHLLTGSVRKSNNSVRISTQLIDTKTENYLWASTFDRELNDIFAIQSEVAFEVAKALETKLTKKEEADISLNPTNFSEAYESYLQGVYHLRNGTIDGLEKSYPLLQQAIEIDPEFAEPHAEIAMYYVRQGSWTGTLTPETARKEALPYILKAIELNPELRLIWLIRKSGIRSSMPET